MKAKSEPIGKSATVTTLRVGKDGRRVSVKGLGALKDGALKIREGVDLLKPIARQALGTPGKPDAR